MSIITNKRMSNGFINPDFNKFLLNQVPITKMTQSEMDSLEKTLIEEIKKHPGLNSIGLSANQLGINKRACLILKDLSIDKELDNEQDYIFLLNPVITKKSEDYFVFWESCLSLPKTIKNPIRTYRHTEVTIQTDNLGELTFKINPEEDMDAPFPYRVSIDTLQTVIVQHEIDHLDGITIKDRNSLNWTIKKTQTYGRNDKVLMKSPTGEIVEIKFKKSNDYYLKGYEII